MDLTLCLPLLRRRRVGLRLRKRRRSFGIRLLHSHITSGPEPSPLIDPHIPRALLLRITSTRTEQLESSTRLSRSSVRPQRRSSCSVLVLVMRSRSALGICPTLLRRSSGRHSVKSIQRHGKHINKIRHSSVRPFAEFRKAAAQIELFGPGAGDAQQKRSGNMGIDQFPERFCCASPAPGPNSSICAAALRNSAKGASSFV
jgi:hypothetical protein